MEDTIRLAVEIFTAVIITGLGGQELFKRWQDYSLKRSEKLFDHDLAKENQSIEWITEQAEYYRLQVEILQRYHRETMEKLQEEKFGVIHADLIKVLDTLTPCKVIMEELLENRANTTQLVTDVKETNQLQNAALKIILERMRIDRSKTDTSGHLSQIMDALGEVQSRREKVQTGTWAIHPPPPTTDESQ
jgi:hypothetical protein